MNGNLDSRNAAIVFLLSFWTICCIFGGYAIAHSLGLFEFLGAMVLVVSSITLVVSMMVLVFLALEGY